MSDGLTPRTRRLARCSWPLALAVTLLWTVFASASAQEQGVVTGQVVDASISEPIPSALVELVAEGGRVARSTITSNDGRFRLAGVSPGTYALVISTVGYETRRIEGVRVGVTPVVFDRIELTSRAFELNPVVVSASRHREKALEAPASVHTVSPEQIEEQPTTTPADYVRGLPGIDVATNGLSQHNVVARGFNDIFSSSLLVLTDNRWASVPSLRFNAYNLIPQTSEDIERIELVLGPGAALYGPNVANGVMHIITKSPFQNQETVASVTGGERELVKGALRHSGQPTEDVAYKVSGMYLRGMDWRFVDPVEAENRAVADNCLAMFDPTNPACLAFFSRQGEPPDSQRLQRIGRRDFEQERFAGTARVDLRLAEQSTLVLEGGTTRMGSSIEMTGIGSAQADDWSYTYFQGRFNRGDLFVQSYINMSDAGDTYLLRDGAPITDNSILYVGQVQHASDVSDQQRFIYGADVVRTIPRTEGSINGRNEDDDNFTELGGYVQSETRLSRKLDLVAAARVDWHSVLEQAVFSPRAGVVFKPQAGHNFRVTYNRAFNQPDANNLFLDIQASPTIGPFTNFSVRASGVPSSTGLTFRRDCGPSASEPCMRSPFNAQPGQYLAPDAAWQFWQDAVDGFRALVEAGALAEVGLTSLDPRLEATLRALDPAGQSGTTLKLLDRFDPEEPFKEVTAARVTDVAPLDPIITNTLEAGYKGVISDRLLLRVDVYYTHVSDFIGPLLAETPNVFLDVGQVINFVGPALVDSGYASIIPVVGVGISNVPLGTITPEQAASPSDVVITYRNFGEVDLWGSDIGATFLATDELSFTGSYSFVSDNFFPNLDGITDVALNASQNKASLTARYRNERARFSLDLGGRWIDSFPVNSGEFAGTVPSYVIFDANVTYGIPGLRGSEVTLSAYNLFDNTHREMVGAPELGRLLLLRLRQTF